MAKVIVILFGFVAAIFANSTEHTPLSSPFTPHQIQAFKEVLEEQIKDEGGLTCKNYHEHCARASGDNPDSSCHIMFNGYLCDKLQNLTGVAEIMSRIKKQHPKFSFGANHKSNDDDKSEKVVSNSSMIDNDSDDKHDAK